MAAKKKASKKKAARKKRAAKAETPPPQKWTWVDGHWCLTQTDAAEWVGVSVTMFRRYEINQLVKRGRTVFYAESELKSLIRKIEYQKGYRAGQASTPKDEADIMVAQARAQLRLTEEQGETAALKNAQLRRELIPVQVVSMVLAKIGSQISGALDPLAGQLKRRIPSMTTAETHVVKEQVAKCKNLAASASIDDWDALDPEGDAPVD